MHWGRALLSTLERSLKSTKNFHPGERGWSQTVFLTQKMQKSIWKYTQFSSMSKYLRCILRFTIDRQSIWNAKFSIRISRSRGVGIRVFFSPERNPPPTRSSVPRYTYINLPWQWGNLIGKYESELDLAREIWNKGEKRLFSRLSLHFPQK